MKVNEVCWFPRLPVQKLPVLSTPAVFEFLRVHAANLFKVRLIDPKQAEAIDLPVAWNTRKKEKSEEATGTRASLRAGRVERLTIGLLRRAAAAESHDDGREGEASLHAVLPDALQDVEGEVDVQVA